MKWWMILIIVVAVGALLYLGQDWQVLSIVGAALAGPFKLLSGLLGKSADDIRQEHQVVREREDAFQERLESNIREKEETIRRLEREMADLDAKIEGLERRKSAVDAKYRSMDIDELTTAGRRYFGS